MTFSDFKIDLGGKTGGEIRTLCPECSHKRKNTSAKCLSVNTDKGTWLCHHCDWRGGLKSGQEQPGKKIIIRPTWIPPTTPTAALIEFFASRGINRLTLEHEKITILEHYIAQESDYIPCIAFPFLKGGEVVNIKYRGLKSKCFQQVSGAEKIFYRQDHIARDRTVIVEGEIDALSIVQAGIDAVVSVPDGAPAPTAKNYASKFTYFDQDPEPFEHVQQIVLAVDNDEPGKLLQSELSRRLGVDRCSYVAWPEGCKDANDVLKEYGGEALKFLIDQAQPFPVQDVVEVKDVSESVRDRYFHGVARGLSTGWENVNTYYTIEPGQLTIVTGIPGHGKSEWLDALMLNLITAHGWRFAVCSPENAPVEQHIEKLLEKAVGAPFRVGPSDRMTPDEMNAGMTWLQDSLRFIMPEDALTLDGLMDRATSLVSRFGIKGLIIDPFNEFDHTRPRGQTETEYIGSILGMLTRWSRKWQVHIWLVAHPQKLYRRDDGTYPVPTPWDINGSANFRNKATNCITVWRDESNPDLPVQIHFQKIRYKHIGRIGMAELAWERKTGRYSEPLSVL